MFSYPNKERRLEWVDKVVAASTAPIESAGTELVPIAGASGSADGHNQGGFDGATGVKRDSSDSLVLLPASLFGWNGGDADGNRMSSDVGRGDENKALVGEGHIDGGSNGVQAGSGRMDQDAGHEWDESTDGDGNQDGVADGVQGGGGNLGHDGDGQENQGGGDDGYQGGGMDNPAFEMQEPEQNGIRRRNVLHVAIAMPPENVVAVPEAVVTHMGPSRFLAQSYTMLYWLGISYYRPRARAESHWIWKFIGIALKVYFTYLAMMSVFQSTCQAKYGYFRFVGGGGYGAFVECSFGLATLFVKLYVIYMLSVERGNTEKMLDSLQEYEDQFLTTTAQPNGSTDWKLWLVVLLTISSWLIAVPRALYSTNVTTFQELILDSSYELSEDIFVWNGANRNVTTQWLLKEYNTKETPLTNFMGSVVLLRDIHSFQQIGLIVDLIGVLCLVAYILMMDLMVDVMGVVENVPMENEDEWQCHQARREVVWWKYRALRAVFKTINLVFDPLWKVMHVNNLLTYAFFMSLLIYSNYHWLGILLFGVNMFKTEISYYISGLIAEQNEPIREWIRNWALYTGTISVGGVNLDAGIILDELEKSPMGLGKGKFLIQPSLHIKLLGLVLSVFFSMADEQKK